jgi:class 3 adenylate cyclase
VADIQGLIQHLRSQSNPGSADVSALAAQFGVDESLVRNAMQTLSRSAPRPEAKKRESDGPNAIGKVARWVESNPGWAIGACGAWACLFMFLRHSMPATFAYFGLGMLAFSLVASLCIVAVSRRARFGVLTGPVLTGSIVLEILISDRGQMESTGIVGFLLLALMISMIGVVCAIIGGLVWLKRRQKLDRNATRQQMLDRLLQVRLALEYPRTTPTGTRWRTFVEAMRRHFWWFTVCIAILMSAIQTVVIQVLSKSSPVLSGTLSRTVVLTPEEMIATVVLACVGFGQFMIMVIIGYFGRAPWRGFVGMLLYHAISYLPALLGISTLAMMRMKTLAPVQIISSYAILLFCTAIGLCAAAIEEYTVRARLRQENDPDALLAELLDLEIALGGGLQESYVLVVDVAGSTAMKKDADPLVAEWTFRAYQEVVSRVGALHGGTVESTAGDGAVLAFPSANQGLAAARALLGAMPAFNASTNRLGQEFVLRIGLHCGEVRGDLNEVQFTRVIDVAAHVEASSPRNGIGMTAVFRDKLDPVPELEKMAVSVDGFDVYVTA